MTTETRAEVTSLGTGYAHRVTFRGHELIADEPVELDGTDAGPAPYELLVASLGSCSAITVEMYARRKGWPLEGVRVDVRHRRVPARECAESDRETGFVDVFDKAIGFDGELSDDQRSRLMEISEKCPVHRALIGGSVIRSAAAA